MKKSWKALLADLLGGGILVLLVFGILAVLALVSGTLMGFLGFRYESFGSLLLYFLFVLLTGLPLDLVASALPRSLVFLKRLSPGAGLILFVVLDILSTVLPMSLGDVLMEHVSASGTSILVVALLCTVTSIKEFQEKLRRDQERPL